jgi:hypothetical protein
MIAGAQLSPTKEAVFLRDLWRDQVSHFQELLQRDGRDFFSIADHCPGYTGLEQYGYEGMLSLMDIQHCMCEYRKYMTWSVGKGMRRRYKS